MQLKTGGCEMGADRLDTPTRAHVPKPYGCFCPALNDASTGNAGVFWGGGG